MYIHPDKQVYKYTRIFTAMCIYVFTHPQIWEVRACKGQSFSPDKW